jgi:hypothetical protein
MVHLRPIHILAVKNSFLIVIMGLECNRSKVGKIKKEKGNGENTGG